MNRSRDEYRSRRLYRNPESGVILGVCAGMAEYFDCPVWLARIGTLALGWFFPLTVVVAYIAAAVAVPERPLRYRGEGDERTSWQSRATGADT